MDLSRYKMLARAFVLYLCFATVRAEVAADASRRRSVLIVSLLFLKGLWVVLWDWFEFWAYRYLMRFTVRAEAQKVMRESCNQTSVIPN
jgi:hypothetical protein